MDLHRQLNSADPQAQELMAGVQPGEYILSHLFYNWNVAELLERLEFKKILVIRDPHDVIVSYIRYVQAAEPQEAHYFLNLPDDDTRLLEAIRGVPFIGVKNVGESLNGILKWLEKSDCLLIRFEDLIGAKGQGSRERQLDTIKRICHYLELDATPQEIARVAGEVFDPGALTFREGQIGTWQRYFKPQHHQAFNKLLDDSIEQFGYKKYQPLGNLPATLPYPVLAITYPGAGLYLLDVVLDTLGLGRQFIIPPYPLSRPAEPDRAVPLDMLTMHRHTYAAVQDLLEEVKNNRYALGYIPFSETGLNIVNRLGFKKIVMGRDRRDAAVALARSLPGSDYPVSGYLRQLPDDAARLMATIKGVTVLESGNAQAFLLSNGELFQHLARWSRQPDTMVVDYADLVGEAGGGSQTRQKAALTEICKYLGIEGNPGYIDFAVSSINQRATPPVIEGAINQWETHFSLQHLRAIE
jgi:hypothetical protein